MVKLSTINPNPNNPRLVKDDKFLLLVESIKNFGEKMMPLRPMVIDENNILLGGNMRYKALKELKYKEVPKEWVKQVLDLTEDEKREFIIKDNIGFGAWDWDTLANEWEQEELEAWGLDIPDFMDEVELEAKEDDYEEPEQMQVDVVLGDLIEIGEHRLLCGDSTCSDTVARLMNGEKADIVFTSPPYNLGTNVSLSTRNKKDNAYESYEDNVSDNDYFDLLRGFTNSFFPYCEYVIVNIQSLAGNKKTVIKYQNEYIDFLADVSVWVKRNPQPAMAERVMNSAFEYLLFISTKEDPSRAISTGNFRGTVSNVYDGTINSENIIPDKHSAAFSMTLAGFYIDNFSSSSVIDCFMGTGTTMAAAHQLKRKCYGMELDPKYCQVIIDRMLKLDSSLEVKINGKEYKPTAIQS